MNTATQEIRLKINTIKTETMTNTHQMFVNVLLERTFLHNYIYLGDRKKQHQ